MTKQQAERMESIVKKTLAKMSLSSLVAQFELTENLPNSIECAMVRGWLMDAIKEQNPIGYDAWLEQDYPADRDLRKFVL